MSTALEAVSALPADVEASFAALSSEAWAHRRAEALRDGSTVVRREVRPEGGVLLVVSRELPDGVPGFLERFLPRERRVTQTDDWEPAGPDGVRRGSWSAEIPGAPAAVGGTMRLEPAGSPHPAATRWTIEGEVKVRVPVIGGKAERYLAAMIERLSEKEAEVLRAMVG